MKENVDQDRYATCWQISADYTRFYAISDNPDGIFFGELCQNIFKEMETLVRGYILSEERLKEIRNQWRKELDNALTVMKSGNEGDIYRVMRGLRVYMTKLQFNTWHTEKAKPREGITLSG
jgi:prephenate dehydrogenase